MRTTLKDSNYDTILEPSDWRFSATIVGLIEYFDYHNIKYEIDDDSIMYNENDITEQRYLEFVESKYSEKLHHKLVESLLKQDEISEEQIKLVNDKLKANTIMKNKFSKIKFDGSNKAEILDIIDKNRSELIKETYRTKSDMYANYANTN
ncbi:MAG: type I CRISPR-associated protein Cas8a1/Csx8, partial [Romboutsia sp.]|nr:type I CRISPR-associated protein Cas8a1/Csx8 [Romboutsia sp.]